jgi:hypothetical protein
MAGADPADVLGPAADAPPGAAPDPSADVAVHPNDDATPGAPA